MDVSRVGRGAMIAAVSGVALLIVMYLSWWGAPDTVNGVDVGDAAAAFGVDTSVNAWQAADLMDIIWFLTAVAAIALGVIAATATRINMPVAMSTVVAGLGILSLVLIVFRLISPPYDLDREYGVFLGLLAIIGIAYGGWTAMQEEGTSFQGEADRLQRRGGPGSGPPAAGGGGPSRPAGETPPPSTGGPPPRSGGPTAP